MMGATLVRVPDGCAVCSGGAAPAAADTSWGSGGVAATLGTGPNCLPAPPAPTGAQVPRCLSAAVTQNILERLSAPLSATLPDRSCGHKLDENTAPTGAHVLRCRIAAAVTFSSGFVIQAK